MVKILNINKEISYLHNDTTSPLKGYNQNYPSHDDCISHDDFETIVRPYVKITLMPPSASEDPMNESISARNNSCGLK